MQPKLEQCLVLPFVLTPAGIARTTELEVTSLYRAAGTVRRDSKSIALRNPNARKAKGGPGEPTLALQMIVLKGDRPTSLEAASSCQTLSPLTTRCWSASVSLRRHKSR